MKRWLGVALGCSGLAMALACAGVLWMPSAETAASSSAPPTAGTAMAAAAVEDPPPVERARTPAAARHVVGQPSAPGLDREQAILFMQMLRDEGDPRSPPLGGLQPRQSASAEALADPKRYQAFEERQTRELVQAYTSGVQQIPEIRARIEAAEQGGERSAEDIDEARAALGQLEMMRDKLQRESPQLLPGDSAPPAPAVP
ncbi:MULTISPECIES: hypothetical protein [Pseudomonas aeruginosa group]|uniref:hypothetical protein n=1 Tax=Pseudomonas aeruginosa group TaxID=136841 RepID=UPI0006B280EC|nr:MULTISPECIES: hypothetical protein [Pseudomonas aeruginosa group]KPD27901.1 hypothetical protein AN920_18625 [Pseudomonas paraeruginosa]KQB32959.1 hypothetical protein AOA77_10760 [Pseudomonas paraeruginosa]MDT1023907.1 hypothetical protein [Pseudomonas paraeruginosa]PHJ31093.1 hypothetical protein CDG78_17405 [Pseudomonas paraeruginosa]QQV48773.1 hypothetical protein JHW37_00140 [Pseudomonas aeruginosa]